jgi:hypothetical protein
MAGLSCAETGCPGNDINVGLPEGANAGPCQPGRYPGSSRPVPGDGVLQVVDMRDTAIVGHPQFRYRARSRVPTRPIAEAPFIRTVLLSSTAANCAFPGAPFAGSSWRRGRLRKRLTQSKPHHRDLPCKSPATRRKALSRGLSPPNLFGSHAS